VTAFGCTVAHAFIFAVQELSSLVMLTQLVLDHNLLRHLPPVVLALPALAVLMASSNSITYLPEGVGQMQQLQALLMHSNQLMQVRSGALPVDNLA
jgi:Leucine-rich repeat (LRR) protein